MLLHKGESASRRGRPVHPVNECKLVWSPLDARSLRHNRHISCTHGYAVGYKSQKESTISGIKGNRLTLASYQNGVVNGLVRANGAGQIVAARKPGTSAIGFTHLQVKRQAAPAIVGTGCYGTPTPNVDGGGREKASGGISCQADDTVITRGSTDGD